jgi:hypothetical protein
MRRIDCQICGHRTANSGINDNTDLVVPSIGYLIQGKVGFYIRNKIYLSYSQKF